MITLNLDWREALWWMQGGMAGSHLRWSVYEEMVNKVWPQCSEQERRNIWLIMRRDLGWSWRPDEWNGHEHMQDKGEGPWRDDILDKTPWEYFRQVLARFDPDNQYAIEMRVKSSDELERTLRFIHRSSVITLPPSCHLPKGKKWESDTATMTVRAYKWQDEYYIDWKRRCADDAFVNITRMEIPDDGTM